MSMWALEAVFGRSLARGADRLVLLVIADRADEHGCCWPGVEYIARRALLGVSTTYRSLTRLEERGCLAIEHRPGRTNRYTMTDPAPLSTRDPSQPGTPLGLRETPPGLRKTPLNPGPNPSVSHKSPQVRAARGTRDARHNGRTKRTPDPRIPRLISAFAEEHRKVLGTPYVVAGGRDGASLKRALRTFDEPAIRGVLPAYFADRRSIDRLGARVPLFVDRIATLTAASVNGTARAVPDFTGQGRKPAAGGRAAT